MTDETREAVAFVPGHVTGFFSVHRRADPARSGSRGAGLTLSDGVTVRVRPAPTRSISLDDESVSLEPVERVLDALEASVAVEAKSDLPLGAGFGVSGALALGTALATNRVATCGLTENELVRTAHVAEVRSETGLGDVVAQARGGVPIRKEPGAPPHGEIDAIPDRTRIEYVTFGDLSTAAVLSGDTDRLSTAGEEALDSLLLDPTLETFFDESYRFARDAGLLTETVRETVEAVHDAGGLASMAMLGRTVFALGTGLSDAGYDASVTETNVAGGCLLSFRDF